jgi:hypothetical protein
MPDTFVWNQFSAGWVPSDDLVNGRKNGLFKMDNLELDKTGSLSLQGGTSVVGSAYSYNAHTLFSNVISGTRCDYLADTNGGIFRNGTSIGTGGDSANAAFCTAFDFTLATSGNTRLKDSGSGTPLNLGIAAAPAGPTAIVDGYVLSTNYFGAYNVVQVLGTWANLSQTGGMVTVDPTTLTGIIQTTTISSGPSQPMDMTLMEADNSLSQSISGLGAQDTDVLTLQVIFDYTNSAIGDVSNISSIELDILLVAGSGDGAVVSDYFSYTWINTGSSGPTFTLQIQRGWFTRIGNGNQDWSNVYGYRITVIANSPIVVFVDFSTNFIGASLLGSYDWVQVNVYESSSYVGMSQISPSAGGFVYTPTLEEVHQKNGALGSIVKNILIAASPNNNTVKITPNITDLDPQVNQIWIFRQGGNLAQWYRVLVFTSANWTVPQYDYLTDFAAEQIDITVNLALVSINSTGITDKIYDIVGPIEGRWWYFTTHFMYPSDINDPDLVNVGLGVRTTGSNAEIFLWARKVAYNQVLVGTSRDIYLLTGTFTTLPDGTVDIYYDSIGAKMPPITYDAVAVNGQVFYLAADGWRSCDVNNDVQLLVAPNTDRLYRGITCYGYSVDIQIVPGSVRFPIAFSRNKLWCSIKNQSRIEVLDSIRSYWRSMSIGKGDCLAMCSTQDGNILAFFAADQKLRELDQQTSLEIDGSTKQTVNLLSPVFDGGTPKQRHEFYTLKVRLATGSGENLAISLITDTGATYNLGNVTSNGLVTEQILQLAILGTELPLSRFWQFSATGTFSQFTLDDIEIDFDTRPIQLTSLRLLPSNYGTAQKKRMRVWPHVIDTMGNEINITPDVDGVLQPTVTFSSNQKQTLLYFFNTDVFGIDYGAFLQVVPPESGPLGTFEYFGALNPDIVQTLPIARQFDQVGPEELFRYGKIRQFEIRVLPFGESALPWTIYFNDNSIIEGEIEVLEGLEQSYFVGVPPGTAGSIVRITFGPTSYNFHRFYVRLQVMRGGRDTEMSWITLPDPSEGLSGATQQQEGI